MNTTRRTTTDGRRPTGKARVLGLALVVLAVAGGVMEAGGVESKGRLTFDFESGKPDGFTVAKGDLHGFITTRQDIKKPHGKHVLTTLYVRAGKSDAWTGVIESPVFTLQGEEIVFLVGGGRHATTYVALCTLDGKEALRASGRSATTMHEIRWNARQLVGKKVFVRIVDAHKGGWGHVTFDHFRATGEIDPAATAQRDKGRKKTAAKAALTAAEKKLLPLREAIADIGRMYPGRYDAAGFLAKLDRIKDAKGGDFSKEFLALQREALLANPLVRRQPILYVSRPQFAGDHHNTATMFQYGTINGTKMRGPGALRVIDFANGGKVTTLVDAGPKGVLRDPEVSFDGKRIVFSMRKEVKDDYHIYIVNFDGTGLKQLTSAKGVTDIDPLYLADGDIVFTSTREPKYCGCNRHIMGNLFRMAGDGANIHQIGKSTLHEGHSTLTPDGRVLYDRWEYVDRNFGDAQGLWTVNPDGTNHAVYWANNTTSPGAVLDGRAIPGTEKFVCTFSSCHDRPWGAIAVVDRLIGVDGRAPVVRTWPASAINLVGRGGFDTFARVRPKYEDPFPLADPSVEGSEGKYFLCARQGKGGACGICLLDVFGNEIMIHSDGPGVFDPMPLGSRPTPQLRPLKRDFTNGPGRFYLQNAYIGTHMKGVKGGSIRYLRVIESPEKRFWTSGAWNGQGQEAPGMNWRNFENKRILGTVPVAADGSAYFEVPADTFVFFQLLDENKMMIHSMRSGTMVQSGEMQGCIGCHEERTAYTPAPSTARLAAMHRPVSKLDGWFGPPRLFNYLAEVQPVFDKHCVQCHDFGKKGAKKLILAGDKNVFFNASYWDLWSKRGRYLNCIGAGPSAIQQAYSWGSHASKLVAVIRKGHNKVKLSAEDMERLVTWLDLNGPYYPSYASAYPNNAAGRSPLSGGQLNQLRKLTGGKSGRGEHISFDRPAMSPCLAGIKDKKSPQYTQALAIIQAGKDMLAKRPRADMSGFVPCEVDRRREEKYQMRRRIELRNRKAIREGRKVYDSTTP